MHRHINCGSTDADLPNLQLSPASPHILPAGSFSASTSASRIELSSVTGGRQPAIAPLSSPPAATATAAAGDHTPPGRAQRPCSALELLTPPYSPQIEEGCLQWRSRGACQLPSAHPVAERSSAPQIPPPMAFFAGLVVAVNIQLAAESFATQHVCIKGSRFVQTANSRERRLCL
jgi:hypothetical protein